MTISSKGRGSSGGARVITLTYAISEEEGAIILLLLYDKADASSVKVSIIKKIAKEIGFDLDNLQKTGKLKPEF